MRTNKLSELLEAFPNPPGPHYLHEPDTYLAWYGMFRAEGYSHDVALRKTRKHFDK